MKMPIMLTITALIISGYSCSSHYYKAVDDQVHIYLKNPDAEKVYFLSSLDQFQVHEAWKNKKGIWETTVPLNREFKYFYIIDGKVFTPDCDLTETDDLGGKNCVYISRL